MSNAILDEFGKLLIREVRDGAIGDWHNLMHHSQNETANPVDGSLRTFNEAQRQAIDLLGRQIIDSVIEKFLCWIESDDRINLSFTTDQGVIPNIGEASDMLAFEYSKVDGWITRFSSFKVN